MEELVAFPFESMPKDQITDSMHLSIFPFPYTTGSLEDVEGTGQELIRDVHIQIEDGLISC